MVRRFVTLLAACGLMAIGPVASVSADTVGGATPLDVYVVGTGFSFTDRAGTPWSGIAQVEDNRLSGERFVSFFFSGPGAQKACDGGTPNDPSDDYVGTEYIEFFATNSRILRYTVASDLSSARVSLAMRGTRIRLDACTGEERSRRGEAHAFAFELQAVGSPDVSTEISCVPLDETGTDGVEVNQVFSYVEASGSATLDGRSVTQTWGNLQHVEATLGDACQPAP